MANQIFQYNLVIKECHLDFFGHVNNAVYLQLLEEARWDFCTRNGFGLKQMKETAKGPIVLEVQLRFLREMTLRQNISIFSQVISHNKKIGKLQQSIKDESGNTLLEAHFVMGFFNMETRKLVTPPQEWLSAIGVENHESNSFE